MTDTCVRYKGKTIDLNPYFEGFPYFGFSFSELNSTLYYFHRTKRITLKSAPLSPHPDLSKGVQISDLDFGSFNAWTIRYLKSKDCLWWVGDEKNDEILNIYFLSLRNGKRTRLTTEDYIYGADTIDDDQTIAFIARRKDDTSGRMISTLKMLDINTGQIEEIISDDPIWTFSWTTLLQHSPSRGLIWRVTQEYDRNRSNLVYFDPASKCIERLLPEGVKRTTIGLLHHWLDPDTFLFLSDESGYTNVYAYHLPTRAARPLTSWTDEVGSAQLYPVGEKKLLFVVREHPVKNTLFVVDPLTGDALYKEEIDGSFSVFSREQERLFAVHTSCSEPFHIYELTPRYVHESIAINRESFICYPEELKGKIIQGKTEAIEYETFDIDSKTNAKRKIHSFLSIPDNLPKDHSKRRAIITAFYGGENRFVADYQILMQAGFIVLSPAVRGSWGFGAEYYALNDRDLGGNEIIDLIYAGRYLAERFGMNENQIGLQGGSHGGYCSMRAATFPSEVNGRRESFKWGFAISSFGISNIVDYHRTCNIPDWVLQKAGDPETEREKLMDRSPVTHADKAIGPILLVHGENDNRVPVDQSRQMAIALSAAQKPYTYIELPGQGHGWRGLAQNISYYSAVFEFLSQLD